MYLGSFVLLLCTYWVLCVPFFLYKVCFLPIKKKKKKLYHFQIRIKENQVETSEVNWYKLIASNRFLRLVNHQQQMDAMSQNL